MSVVFCYFLEIIRRYLCFVIPYLSFSSDIVMYVRIEELYD